MMVMLVCVVVVVVVVVAVMVVVVVVVVAVVDIVVVVAVVVVVVEALMGGFVMVAECSLDFKADFWLSIKQENNGFGGKVSTEEISATVVKHECLTFQCGCAAVCLF